MTRKIIGLLSLAAVLLAGCVRDRAYRGAPSGEARAVRFTFSIPGAASRAVMSDADEGRVREVDVLVFDASGHYLERPEIDLVGDNEYEVLLLSSVRDVMILCNARSAVEEALAGFMPKTTTWDDARGLIVERCEEKWLRGSIPMFGQIKDVEFDAAEVTFNIGMLRMLARVDMVLMPQATGTDYDNFELKEVYFCNYNTRGLVVPAGDGSAVSLPDDAGTVTGTDYALWWQASKPGAFTGELYAFESATAGDTTDPDANACLIFGGSYRGSGAMSWYRVDFKKEGKYIPLLRNHRYNLIIKKISGAGYPTLDQAYNDPHRTDAEADILAWEQKEGDLDFGGGVVLPAGESDLSIIELYELIKYLQLNGMLSDGDGNLSVAELYELIRYLQLNGVLQGGEGAPSIAEWYEMINNINLQKP